MLFPSRFGLGSWVSCLAPAEKPALKGQPRAFLDDNH